MSEPKPDVSGDGDGKGPVKGLAAGIVVFSGIAMSVLGAFFPNSKAPGDAQPEPSSLLSSEPITAGAERLAAVPIVKPTIVATTEAECEVRKVEIVKGEAECEVRKVEIVKGDTLWGLSRKYGVSVEEIKEANGLSGDTIYAGKKLVIP